MIVDLDIEHQRFPFPDNTFDFVLFLEVIEHLITGPTRVLQELARVLKPGGILVLTTDNSNSLYKPSGPGSGNRTVYWPYNDSLVRRPPQQGISRFTKSGSFLPEQVSLQ
ncbi:MAG: class I SAM-dependent methyltransferase [Desulfobacterales bacterium]|nr:class I SAM-dependent methyltransferase [Desulfobacterales bacterium]